MQATGRLKINGGGKKYGEKLPFNVGTDNSEGLFSGALHTLTGHTNGHGFVVIEDRCKLIKKNCLSYT
jgi:hypothetical protein